MRFDPFPDDLNEALASALAHPLRSLLEGSEDLSTASTCTWHETCQVITVDLPDNFSTDSPLKSYFQANKKEIWHHQIKVNDQPILYARSLVRQTSQGRSLGLIELVRSSLALRFEDTLDTLESLNEPPGADWVVRLLVIPRYNEGYFAIFQGEEIRHLVALQLQTTKLLNASTVGIEAGSLLSRLKDRPEFIGLRSNR